MSYCFQMHSKLNKKSFNHAMLTCNAMVNLQIPLVHYDRWCGSFFHSMHSYKHILSRQIDLNSELQRSIVMVLFNTSLHLFGTFYHLTKIPPCIINGANAQLNNLKAIPSIMHVIWFILNGTHSATRNLSQNRNGFMCYKTFHPPQKPKKKQTNFLTQRSK